MVSPQHGATPDWYRMTRKAPADVSQLPPGVLHLILGAHTQIACAHGCLVFLCFYLEDKQGQMMVFSIHPTWVISRIKKKKLLFLWRVCAHKIEYFEKVEMRLSQFIVNK